MVEKYRPKLAPGDIIQVFGWCMLNKIEEGRYRISKVEEKHGSHIYSFTKPKGTKVLIRHYAHVVDTWIKDISDPNLNKIVKTPA